MKRTVNIVTRMLSQAIVQSSILFFFTTQGKKKKTKPISEVIKPNFLAC